MLIRLATISNLILLFTVISFPATEKQELSPILPNVTAHGRALYDGHSDMHVLSDVPEDTDNLLSRYATQPQATHVVTSIEGTWSGALDLGATKWPLTLIIFKTKIGGLTAAIVSLDTEPGQPVSFQLSGNELSLTAASIGASFHGKVNTTASEIIGEWKQGRALLPIKFLRSSGKSGVIGGVITSAGSKDQSEAPPAKLAGFEDEASFSLFVNQEKLGIMHSSWTLGGSFQSQVAVTKAEQTVRVTTIITPDSGGRWVLIATETPLTTIAFVSEGSTITRIIGKNITTWPSREGLLLYDDNSPALLSQAVRTYNELKGGSQKFPVLAIPIGPGAGPGALDLTLEAKEKEQHIINGRNLSLMRFHASLSEREMHILADSSGEIYKVEWPAQNVILVRQGYEELKGKDSDLRKTPQ